MKKEDKKLKRIEMNPDSALNLASAILIFAATEYQQAAKALEHNQYIMSSTEHFFGTEWAQMLGGDLDVRALFDKLEEKTKNEKDKTTQEVIKAMKKSLSSRQRDRIELYTEDGVLYIFGMKKKNSDNVKKRACEILQDMAWQQVREREDKK